MIRYATLASLCLVLFGCGNSVECDSAEVRKVLREIVEENTKYTIMDYKAVTTVSSTSNKWLKTIGNWRPELSWLAIKFATRK